MSIAVIIQFAALAVIVAIGGCVVYAIFEMREVYAEQQAKFSRAIGAVAELQPVHPEFTAILQQAESDGHELQKIALQVEVAVAALKDSTASSEKLIQTIAEQLRAARESGTAPALHPEAKAANGDYIRVRKDLVSTEPELRFCVLKDWISINSLAIVRRASRTWNTPNDLIANIPPYLQPEAEINGDRILYIGTRGHSNKIKIPLGEPELTTHEVLPRRTDV